MGGHIKTDVETANFVMTVMNIWLRFFSYGATAPSGLGLPQKRGVTITLRHTTLSRTLDQPVTETST